MSHGKLIVLEGLDGSGKATQAKRLAAALAAEGRLVREITFPNYASDSSALVRMYLAGQFGARPDDVNAYAASSFYAVDRYASYKTDWGEILRRGRHPHRRPVHHLQRGAPVLEAAAGSNGSSFCTGCSITSSICWACPHRTAVIYLQVDPAVSQKLMTQRYHGDESKKDVHEKDVEYLARSRRAAEYCAAHLGWADRALHLWGRMRSVRRDRAGGPPAGDAALAE